MALSIPIPIIAIILSHKRKMQANKIMEFELQKEILDLENENIDKKNY